MRSSYKSGSDRSDDASKTGYGEADLFSAEVKN